jgi:Zn-dependent protease
MQRDAADVARRQRGLPFAEPGGPGENEERMHEQRPSEPDGDSLAEPAKPAPPPVYRGYEPAPPKKPAWRTAGGFAGAAALFFAKFKGLLLVLLNLKWLLFVPKLLISFGTLFLSIWFYALFFGWKFGIVFVLLILVHELGHYVTFRNFGIKANLPFFIPGLGAFVAARGPAPSMTIEAIATLAGPIFGIAASAICYGYAVSTHEPFWYAAAYVGFFLNALNLLPIPPFDGGRIAGTIDPRLWIVGLFAFLGFLVFFGVWSSFTIIMIVLVALGAIPRIIGLFRGVVDPRLAEVPAANRWAIAVAYFVTIALAVAGAAVSHVQLPMMGAT